MLLEKYEPKSLEQFLWNKEQVKEIMDYIRRKKTILLSGHTGSGKSLLAGLIAKKLGYELVEAESLQSCLKAVKERSIFHKSKLIMIELDMMRDLRGLSDVIKESHFPIILIATDPYDRRFQNLRRSCKIIKLSKPTLISMVLFLKNICKKEKILISDVEISEIAKNCGGDIRAAIIDLESGSQQRSPEENIFELINSIPGSDLSSSREILFRNDADQIFLWIEENTESSCLENYELLAKADFFRARIIKRQSWELKKYFSVLLAAAAQQKRRNPILKYPRYFYAKKPEYMGKIAKQLHISVQEAAIYLPLIKAVGKKDIAFLTKIGLNDEDCEILRNE
ncbi:MAG: hypothetical protein HZB67_01315 [Candidatus Aenigmarchaeota archaeon]|nr:hypothetical protein [Candidatus Aenigmarchaeota archaeon]